LLAPSEKEKLANMATMADVAQKTQQAYGTPAVDENEVRAVGELEPRKEVAPPNPDDKVTTDDPLSDDPGAKSKVGTPIIPAAKSTHAISQAG
jgi:hypothetical protein